MHGKNYRCDGGSIMGAVLTRVKIWSGVILNDTKADADSVFPFGFSVFF